VLPKMLQIMWEINGKVINEVDVNRKEIFLKFAWHILHLT